MGTSKNSGIIFMPVSDDTKDIERAVKGFGLHPGWKNKEVKEKENTGSKDGNDNTNKDQIDPEVNNQGN